MQLADMMSKSDLVPQQFRGRPADVMIAVQYGAELGLPPLQALSGIAVINGRACVWGDAALAVVQASGTVENIKEMTFEEIATAGKAVFWGKRKGIPEPFVREFSLADAKKAGLLNKKGPWSDYTPRMLQMRARAFGLRDGWADILKGMGIREEIEDIPAEEAPAALAMPRRLSEQPEQIPETTEPGTPQDQGGLYDNPPADEPESVTEPEGGPTDCPECGAPLTWHPTGKYGPWWSCSTYKETSCSGKISLKKWERDRG